MTDWPTPEAEHLADAEYGGPPFSYPNDPPCNGCGGFHPDGDWSCPRLDPAPHGGRGDFHNCQDRYNPNCQGECGG